MKDFGIIAGKYDIYNSADYDSYASFAQGSFSESRVPVTEVLDLGCGTGELTVRLADMGFSMTAADGSEEMLAVLTGKIKGRDIQPICQDMRFLDLYGTVQGCVSSFDCLNYLLTSDDLNRAVAKVGFFMEEGGIFVFDVNTDYAYKSIYANNSYVYEERLSMLVWRNYYNEKTRKCDFYLTSFYEDGRGKYIRNDAVHVQKNHTYKAIKTAVENAGFDIVGIFGGTDRRPLTGTDPKAYYVLRKNRQL
ncbi:MAG: class I SAM-dependent methyltransferase [Eubacteriales bacterium]|nr:class I SAM-dependent methyltransferase [Eubacteriales bacterium]